MRKVHAHKRICDTRVFLSIGSSKPDQPNPGLSRNFPASLFVNVRRILYRNARITMLKKDEQFKLVLVAGSEIEIKNFSNPGLT